MSAKFAAWWAGQSSVDLIWLAVGLIAQLMFSMRFIVQWLASERARVSIVPETFWYFSFVGGLLLFIYAIREMQPVFILGQGMGLFIYARNIWLIWRHKHSTAGGGGPKIPAS